VADVSWEIPRTKVGNRIVVVAWAVFALAAVGTGVLIYQAVAGSDGGVSGVSDPLPPTTVGTVSTGTTTPSTPGTATSSAAVSPTVKPPLLPAAAAKPTREGAQAFFEHFLRVYTYSYNSLDTAPLKAISMDGCKFCTSAITNVDEARAADQSIDPGVITITAIVTAPLLNKEDGTVVTVVVNRGPLIAKDPRGEVLTEVPGVRAARLDALVVWATDRWLVRGVQIVSEGT
jgi:hypothetical protein